MPRTGKCMNCGAQVWPRKLSNCNPPINPCPDCDQCECLARHDVAWEYE